jgi:non-ribosomal peptide synthetase component E (peptide arylation enzyme)
VTGAITGAELARELAARLEDHKVPPQISVVESFPLSVNGKVDKRRLAEVVPA